MKRQSGFSLIELMTVIAIMAILAAIAIPNVFGWVATQRFNSAARDVQAAVMNMRLYALKENTSATIMFTTTTYQTKNNNPEKLPPGVTVTSTFTGGVLTFNSRGMATSAGTITVTGQGGKSLNIIINLTGSVQIG